jgi:hypothetical protein
MKDLIEEQKELKEQKILEPTYSKKIKPHHIRHFISGFIVFTLSFVVNESAIYLHSLATKPVRWSSFNKIILDIPIRDLSTNTVLNVEVGFRSDGVLVWREIIK